MGRVQNETYSEYCHAAYKIKGTAHDSNMIAIIQHAETPLTTEEGVQKVNAFSH